MYEQAVREISDIESQMEDEEEETKEETNSGVKFSGDSLDALINSAVRVSEILLHEGNHILVEYRESQDDVFAFRYIRGQKLIVGKCEWCNSRNILKTVCKCKQVKYCNDDCLEKDKKFHEPKCTALLDYDLREAQMGVMTENSRRGIVGLTNLGNTCYMNSSIQCLSNTYELTEYFLKNRYKSLVEREWKNPLGTEGRIVMAWARLMSEMWIGEDDVCRPMNFKTILGQYNITFEGYGQHDSQECISTILDFMSEDLFKRNKKPYVEMTESDGKSDEQASLESWNKHIYRNESII